jgi:hypothetical protein
MKKSTSLTKNRAARRRRFHLDKRADALATHPAATEGSDEDLLTTQQTANWLGVSAQWLEAGRVKDYGPEFVRLAPQIVRYTRGKVRVYIDERRHANTREYSDGDRGRARQKNRAVAAGA